MNRYSNTSRKRLGEAHRDLQTVFSVALEGWDHTILTGHRGEVEQEAKYQAGQSKVRWPNSKHNSAPSMAVDAAPWPIPEKWGEGNRDELEKFRYFAFYVIGIADALKKAGEIQHSIRWGGDWDRDKDVTDQSFNDLVHFELVE